jgi:hypothetical protein
VRLGLPTAAVLTRGTAPVSVVGTGAAPACTADVVGASPPLRPGAVRADGGGGVPVLLGTLRTAAPPPPPPPPTAAAVGTGAAAAAAAVLVLRPSSVAVRPLGLPEAGAGTDADAALGLPGLLPLAPASPPPPPNALLKSFIQVVRVCVCQCVRE